MTTRKQSKPRKNSKRTRAPAARSTSAKRAAVKKPVQPVAAAKTPRAAAAVAIRPSVSAIAPLRAARRAIFIDVENTSSEDALSEVLEGLRIDHAACPTELTAVGNWRTVGQRLGRHLASLGAQLVHSAPATGVRDWSDLWIAVAAGCWLGQSSPGDILEIVSNDRAFDAVGDAAAARGVTYQRLQHRRGAVAAASAAESKPSATRRSRGGRRRRGRGYSEQPLPAVAAPSRAPSIAPVSGLSAVEPHGATREQMTTVIDRITGGDRARWVNLDVLEKALKAEGFARPPGSPRLVTRLRMLKEVEIDSHGRVRLTPGAQLSYESPAAAEDAGRDDSASVEPVADAKPSGRGRGRATPPKRRRRRRSKAAGGSASSKAAPVEAQPTPQE